MRRQPVLFARLFTARGVLVALSLLGGSLATSLLPTGQAWAADTPQICDTLPQQQVGDLSGDWANDGETVTITQVGTSVTGIAFYSEGGSATYTGCFDGTTFYLAYTNAVDDGYGQLTLSVDGSTLQGFWYSYESNDGQHSWTLQRVAS
jgi:hypothetical protein